MAHMAHMAHTAHLYMGEFRGAFHVGNTARRSESVKKTMISLKRVKRWSLTPPSKAKEV